MSLDLLVDIDYALVSHRRAICEWTCSSCARPALVVEVSWRCGGLPVCYVECHRCGAREMSIDDLINLYDPRHLP